MRIVVSIDDSRLDGYRDLPSARENHPLAVIEGRLLIRRICQYRVEFESVLCAPRWADEMETLLPKDVPVFVSSKVAIDRLLGFKFHRGCLALVQRPASKKPVHRQSKNDDLLSSIKRTGAKTQTLVAASQLSDPVNVGTLIRNAAAFGVDHCLIDEACADPFGRRATRAAMGYNYDGRTSRFSNLGYFLEQLQKKMGFRVYATTPGASSLDLSQVDWSPRRVLLFGNEGSGLSEELLSRADQQISIPMAPGVDSLNVSSTAAIVLYRCMQGQCV